MRYFFGLLFLILALSLGAAPTEAQEDQGLGVYPEPKVDQLMAPIALYPDQVLTQIFIASTYPQEVLEAYQWLQNPYNTSLQRDDLYAALSAQPWDNSVKSLVMVPQVLNLMVSNMNWTEEVGEAFLDQPNDLMNSVQHLRQLAYNQGVLRSSPQQTVYEQNGSWIIQSTNPERFSVPYYNTASVYGAWPWPDYPPSYFAPPPTVVSAYPNYVPGSNIILFAPGLIILSQLWEHHHIDWHEHHIELRPDISAHSQEHRPHDDPDEGHGGVSPVMWHHEPEHRENVPYLHREVQQKFVPVPAPEHFEQHGYSVRPTAPQQVPTPMDPHVTHASFSMEKVTQVAVRRSAPLFESMPHGQQAQIHAARGSLSRSAPVGRPAHQEREPKTDQNGHR